MAAPNTPTGTGPLPAYRERLAAGALAPDPAQSRAAEVLQDLWRRTRGYDPHPEEPEQGGFFARFMRRKPVAADEAPAGTPMGLYLVGEVGRGKSMLMDLFYGAVDIPAKRRVHFHAFMQEIHQGMHEARKRHVDDALAPVAEAVAAQVRLLAFDEMQITDITDAMIVGRLFEMLMADGVVIVTTSNRPPEDLYKDGLNRASFLPFIALLRDRMEVRELISPTDYRQHRLEGAQVYFTPAGHEAKAAIGAIWNDLTGGARPVPLLLPVNGRKVEIPGFASGVGRASFWDLCARPLGPADFLAIAGAVRVLILEDVPQLSSSNYNEAKRFVTLIDALYEAKVRLICSAAEVPERLYIEGEGSFEFDRTASRLREMQAADWGGTE
jgi:cell division protein ZapE